MSDLLGPRIGDHIAPEAVERYLGKEYFLDALRSPENWSQHGITAQSWRLGGLQEAMVDPSIGADIGPVLVAFGLKPDMPAVLYGSPDSLVNIVALGDRELLMNTSNIESALVLLTLEGAIIPNPAAPPSTRERRSCYSS